MTLHRFAFKCAQLLSLAVAAKNGVIYFPLAAGRVIHPPEYDVIAAMLPAGPVAGALGAAQRGECECLRLERAGVRRRDQISGVSQPARLLHGVFGAGGPALRRAGAAQNRPIRSTRLEHFRLGLALQTGRHVDGERRHDVTAHASHVECGARRQHRSAILLFARRHIVPFGRVSGFIVARSFSLQSAHFISKRRRIDNLFAVWVLLRRTLEKRRHLLLFCHDFRLYIAIHGHLVVAGGHLLCDAQN